MKIDKPSIKDNETVDVWMDQQEVRELKGEKSIFDPDGHRIEPLDPRMFRQQFETDMADPWQIHSDMANPFRYG